MSTTRNQANLTKSYTPQAAKNQPNSPITPEEQIRRGTVPTRLPQTEQTRDHGFDYIYSPEQRFRFALQARREQREKLVEYTNEDATAQTIFNFSTITPDPLVSKQGEVQFKTPYDKDVPKTDDRTKSIDKFLKDTFKGKPSDGSVADKNELALLIMSAPGDDIEAHVWYSVDLKQSASVVQEAYAKNFAKKLHETILLLLYAVKTVRMELSSAILLAEKKLSNVDPRTNTTLVRECCRTVWADNNIKNFFRKNFKDHPDFPLLEYLLEGIERVLSDKFVPQLNDVIMNAKTCVGKVREMTISVEGFSHRFFGIDRLRGITRRKYLPMFSHCCDVLCFIVNGTSLETVQASYEHFVDAFMTLPVPTGVIVIAINTQALQNKVQSGTVTIPMNSPLYIEGNRPFINTLELLFKNSLTCKNFTGKYFFDDFDTTGNQSAFDCIIKRAREFVLSLRQDRIISLTS